MGILIILSMAIAKFFEVTALETKKPRQQLRRLNELKELRELRNSQLFRRKAQASCSQMKIKFVSSKWLPLPDYFIELVGTAIVITLSPFLMAGPFKP